MTLATTTKTQQFAGKILIEKSTGKKKLELSSPKFYQHQINKFNPNDPITIYLTNQRPKRTEQQNRYYWGIYLPLISQETGERDLERLHVYFKVKFLTESIVKVLGEPVRITKSTANLSTNDFCEYILNIQALTGVEPPPTQNYSLAPLR